MSDLTHPFATLTPDRVLNVVEALGHEVSGRLLALNSFENRVYRVGVHDGPPLIAKFYRPGRWSDEAIREEHQLCIEYAAAELPVAAALTLADGDTLAIREGFRVALFQCLGGRAPVLEDADQLRWIGRMVGRMHLIGARRRFALRLQLGVAEHGRAALARTLAGPLLPAAISDRYREFGQALIDAVDSRLVAHGPWTALRLHGDLHPGNLLWADSGPQFVDLDDALSGPAVQDLWMLLPGDAQSARAELDALLEGYETFRSFDYSEIGLIEALRGLRMLHFAGWLSSRADDPAFAHAFPQARQARYWDEQLWALAEQTERVSAEQLA